MTARDGLADAPMLALDDPSWTTLTCAGGSARGIPALLAQLDGVGEETWQSEPWHSLWAALCDEGRVHPASFAAVPHIVAALAEAPERATPSHFVLPASIELARALRGGTRAHEHRVGREWPARVDALGPRLGDGRRDGLDLLAPEQPALARVRVEAGHADARRGL